MTGTNDETDPIDLLANDPNPGGPGSALYAMKSRTVDDSEPRILSRVADDVAQVEIARLRAELDAAYERAACVAQDAAQTEQDDADSAYSKGNRLSWIIYKRGAQTASIIAGSIRALKTENP